MSATSPKRRLRRHRLRRSNASTWRRGTRPFVFEPLEERLLLAFTTFFELNRLLPAEGGDGTTGLVINGIDADDRSGSSVRSAGDVNGDGFGDVILGAPQADPNSNARAGEAYVLFGKASGFSATLELSALDGTNGFVLGGIDASDRAGYSVSGAGDVNGDGFDDLLIGAPYGDPNSTTNAGETYVVFGKASGFTATLNLSALDGTNGFAINGIDTSDRAGNAVSGAGDVNGDGFDDVVIGASRADPNGNDSGESYVVFGGAGPFAASLNLSALDGTNGFVVNGINAGDRSGFSVSDAGDFNNDGFDDVLMGAFRGDPNGADSGESYLLFGGAGPFAASLNLSTLNGTNGFVLNGIDAGDRSGYSVGSAGDINGDGFDDVAIGAILADPNAIGDAGESYVVFGAAGPFAASLELSSLDGSDGFVVNGAGAGERSGISVRSLGDFTGDGFDDLAIGAHFADPNGSNSGTTYLLEGKASGFSASFDLSALDGTMGSFGFNGIDSLDNAGISIDSAGDFNGDGLSDLLIGAPFGDPNGNSNSGESYVVFGQVQGPFTFDHPFDLSRLLSSNGGDGTEGFIFNGIDEDDWSGQWVSGAGDINGDGFDEVFIGVPQGSTNAVLAGESYIVFGKPGGFTPEIDPATLDGTNGFIINGKDFLDHGGEKVSAVGDFNGDGFDDLLIGTRNGGETYLVFGKATPFAATLELSDLDGTDGFTITGGTGRAVSGAGDVNGDGFNDILTADLLDQETYVVFGSAGPFGATLDVSALDGTNGFLLNGVEADDFAGYSVAGAGDVNGDGFDDLFIGALEASPNGNARAGEAYLVFGKAGPFAASFELSSLDGTNGFVIHGIDPVDQSSRSLSEAGDFNGDGFDDLLIGALSADPNGKEDAGESYLLFGGAGPFAASMELSALDGTNGFVINGLETDDFSGRVGAAGDVNNDGFDDFLIGASSAEPAGEVYLLYGNPGPFGASLEISDLDGVNGVRFIGIPSLDGAGVGTGRSARGAGDVNGDGADDLVIGAWLASPNGVRLAGQSYVIFGVPVPGVEGSPPEVTEVLVKGSAWPQAFLDHLAATGLGSGGFSIPTGSGAQLDPLSWSGVNQVLLRFSEDVDVQQSDLEIRGVNVASYAFSGFSYNPATFEATWTLASNLAADKLLLDLDGTSISGVTDVDDGLLLDGEFVNSVDSLPASGDGTAGGDFEFRIDVLPGDVNQNGAVTTADVGLTRSRVGNAIGGAGYDKLIDVNANGAITTADVGFVRFRVGTVLPGPEPTSASRSRAADAAFEALAVREPAGRPVLKRQSTEPVLAPQMQTRARLLSNASSSNQPPPRREADATVSFEKKETTPQEDPEWMEALALNLSVSLQTRWKGVSGD